MNVTYGIDILKHPYKQKLCGLHRYWLCVCVVVCVVDKTHLCTKHYCGHTQLIDFINNKYAQVQIVIDQHVHFLLISIE